VLLPLTAVIALRYVIDSLNVVQVALLTREMRFGILAKIQVASTLVSGLAGLAWAAFGGGVWSLVVQSLGMSAAMVVGSWVLAGWRPAWAFERQACRELFGFSAYLLGSNVIQYWARNLDHLLIGRFVGPAALGHYSRAYSLMLLPLTQVSRVIGQVMFPALSAIQNDKPRIVRIYLKSVSIIGLITFPMMTGLFAVSDHFIPAVLGDKWLGAIPILKVFCWIGLLQSVTSTVGWIYLSQGRSGLILIMGTIFSIVFGVSFVVGMRWGVVGVAWGYALANLAIAYPCLAVPCRLVDLPVRLVVRSVIPALGCALAMGAAVWAVGFVLPGSFKDWHYLAIQIPMGVLLYVALATSLRLQSWSDAFQAVSEMAGKRLKPQPV
jgi:O-antigen/teichoic acid export membrane protein